MCRNPAAGMPRAGARTTSGRRAEPEPEPDAEDRARMAAAPDSDVDEVAAAEARL